MTSAFTAGPSDSWRDSPNPVAGFTQISHDWSRTVAVTVLSVCCKESNRRDSMLWRYHGTGLTVICPDAPVVRKEAFAATTVSA